MTEHSLQWDDDKVKRFWNFESRFPERYFTSFSGKRIASFASAYLKSGSKVLDYGAGAGHLIESLLSTHRSCQIVAVDYSGDSVQKITDRFSNHPHFGGAFLPDTIRSGPHAGSFDLIFLIETIEHLEDKPLHQTFDTIRHLLKPKGIAIITTPYREDLAKGLVCCPECAAVYHRWQHVRSWSEASLRSVLEQQDFTVQALLVKDFSTHPFVRFLKSVRTFLTGKTAKNNDSLKLVAIVSRNTEK